MSIVIDGSNAQIMNAVRSNASLEYQSRIPAITDGNISKALTELDRYTPMWNEFVITLLNTIGLRYFNANLYENRLRPLKSGALAFGGMVEEYSMNLIEGQEYDVNDTNVFDADAPDIEVNWHRINSRLKYPLAVNEDLLAEACETEGGLSEFVTYIMTAPQNSAEWDEYKQMLELLGKYQEKDGFANVQVSDILTAADPEAAGKQLVKAVATWYEKSKFYRKDTNAAGIDAVSRDMILLATPEIQASYNVDVLAAAFNMDRARFMADRVLTIDRWPANLEGTQAILLDSDWYKVYQTKNKITSIYNPSSLNWIHYLHRWAIMSASRMRPAVRFSTDTDSIDVPVQYVAYNLTLGSVKNTATGAIANISTINSKITDAIDGLYQMWPTLVLEDPDEVAPDITRQGTAANVFYLLSGSISGNGIAADKTSVDVILPDTGTYIDRQGVLHIGKGCEYSNLYITACYAEDSSKNVTVEIGIK